jgi:pimeloyl-ACP methyl ester carboxylesterase
MVPRVVFLTWCASLAQGIDHDETLPGYLSKYNIPVEQHYVTTDDGYILGMFRLPHRGAQAVLFQHGVLDSSWTWICNDPSLSAGIEAFNLGYDVWLSNTRGNTFSRDHQTLSLSSEAFWDFSFTDMAQHDVPANVDYVLQVTGRPDVTFVGHSQGTSQFFAAMIDESLQSDLLQKVNLFVALSPVTFLANQGSTLIEVMSDFDLGAVMELAYPYGFLTWSSVSGVADFFCKATAGLLCKIGVDLVAGVSDEDSYQGLTNFTAHYPAGTSVKSLEHYEQLAKTTKFQDYDYGLNGNLERYGSSSPPEFDLSRARIPTALFIGGSDDLAGPVDAGHAAALLPQDTLVFHEVFDDFSHATWLAGKRSAYDQWFPKFKGLLAQYNPTTQFASPVVV